MEVTYDDVIILIFTVLVFIKGINFKCSKVKYLCA